MSVTLVTGGTGFLGGETVKQLIERGDNVRVLARKLSPTLSKMGAEVVVGDVLDKAGLAPAMAGVKQVYHLAGLVSRNARDASKMMKVHVDGSRNIIESAVAAGVTRIVVASSSGTIAVSKSPQVFAEHDPYAVKVAIKWPYYASKIYQEKLCFDLGERLGIDIVCVNPSLLLGPGDKRLSSVGDVRAFLRKEIPFIPAGGVNFVDVRDAAKGTIAAMEQGKAGERYFLGGPNWTMKEFLGRLARVSKVEGPALPLPPKLAKIGARLAKRSAKVLGVPSKIDPVAVDMSQHFWYVSSSKAKKELGFEARDPALTLADTVADLRSTL